MLNLVFGLKILLKCDSGYDKNSIRYIKSEEDEKGEEKEELEMFSKSKPKEDSYKYDIHD